MHEYGELLAGWKMSNSLSITLSIAGMVLLICSCARSPADKEQWEFPLEQTGDSKEESPTQPSITLPEVDPFRSPDVTRTLPGPSPAFRPVAKPMAPRIPASAPLPQPALNAAPSDSDE